MACFQGTIRSAELAMDTQLSVILPWDRPAENQQTPCKVLYLLHGLGDNAASWTRYTRIESYAREYGMAVVMPEVQRGFYRDMQFGLKYFSYVAKELPLLCNRFFGLDTSREKNYIAGLSMGGYGAVKCGLSFPLQYAGCASFSGVLDFHHILEEHLDDQNRDELTGLLGNELEVLDSDDLFKLAENVAALPRAERPGIFITCGKQDFLYKTNADFTACLDRLGLGYTYYEWDGEHEWGFWDESVRMALKFFAGLSPAPTGLKSETPRALS